MRKGTARIMKAAILALVAGAITAVANPAPSIAHDARTALASAAHLTLDAVSLARSEAPRDALALLPGIPRQ